MMDSAKYVKLVRSVLVTMFSHAQRVDIATIQKISHMDYYALTALFQIKLASLLQPNAQSALQVNIVWLVNQQELAMQVIFVSMEQIHPFLTTDWERMPARRVSTVVQEFPNQ